MLGETPRIINHSKKEYQGRKQNWDIGQFSNGTMVFANTGGLLLYDGDSWQLKTLPHEQIIRTICIDNDRIFVGAYGEFGYWYPDENGLLTYRSLSEENDHLEIHDEEIWKIVRQGEDILFQSFGTIYRFSDDTIYEVTPPHSIRLLHKVYGRDYLQVSGHGLMQLAPDDAFNVVLHDSLVSDYHIVGMEPWTHGSILVATARNGLFILSNDGTFRKWEIELADLLKSHQINKTKKLFNGQLVIGTISSGIYIIDSTGVELQHLNRSVGLQNNTVLSLFEDRDQNLWLGLDDGISHIRINDPIYYYTDLSGQVGTPYTALLHLDQLYIGTNQGLFSKEWSNTYSSNTQFKMLQNTQGQVWDLQRLDGQIFCGNNSGTFIIENQKATQISTVSGGWCLSQIPGRSDLLIQGTYNGLVRYEKSPDNTWVFAGLIDGFRDVTSRLAFDKEGWLWAANPYRGLHRLWLDEDFLTVDSVAAYGVENGLPNDYKVHLIELNDTLFFYVGDSYYHFDYEHCQFVTATGMLADLEGKIIPGACDDYFQVHENGVAYWQNNENIRDLSLSLVQGFEGIYSIDAESYLICLEDGYAIIDRNQKVPGGSDRNPLITAFQAWDRSGTPLLQLYGEDSMIGRDIQLKRNLRRLSITYASPDYFENHQFRYKLEGFDSDWSAWSSESDKEYTNLPPGEYHFKVQVNSGSSATGVSFVVLPAWYETWWAKVLTFAIVFYIIYLVKRLFEKRMLFQKRQLELQKQRALHHQRLDLENKLLENEVISKSRQLANSTMNIIQKNEVMMQLQDELKSMKTKMGKDLPDKQYHRLIRQIQQNISNNQDWKIFETNFNEVHDNFFKSLKKDHPNLTIGDLRLAAYLKMNLSSKEIAPLLNISVRGVENKRYRLRKKMKMGKEERLIDELIKY